MPLRTTKRRSSLQPTPKNHKGFILLTTVLILLVASLLFVSAVNTLLTQIQSATHQMMLEELSISAENDLHRIERGIVQHQMPVIHSHYTITPINTDVCGNSTLRISVERYKNNQRFVLQTGAIFARVNQLKNCKPRPLIQRLWWLEN